MKKPSILVRSIVAAAFSAAIPILTAQRPPMDPCAVALIQQVDYQTLDEQSAVAYLSQIDKETWDSKKTDAGFIGTWTGFLGPMSADFSYEQFNSLRTRFFEKHKYDASSATAIKKLRRYITPEQLDAWVKCREKDGRFGLFLLEKSVDDDEATFELLWIKHPGGPDELPITSSQVTGGRSLDPDVPPNMIFPKGEKIPYGSKIFSVTREPSRPLKVTINAPGFAVTDTIDSSRILALEGNVRVLRNELDAAVSRIKTLTAEQESLRKGLGSPPDKMELSSSRAGSPDDGSVTLTCPPGTYMYGISFAINRGSMHGVVNNVTPIYKPFLPQLDKKQP
jgi:hypothetical protein